MLVSYKNVKGCKFNNSSRLFIPWGSNVLAKSIKLDSLAFLIESRDEWISSAGIRLRQKMFSNSSGFGFNVSFVDKASMFVESVFETSLSFVSVL